MVLDFNTVSYGFATFSLSLLLAIELKNWRPGISSLVLLGATTITWLWCLSLLFWEQLPSVSIEIVLAIESFKNLAWIALLLSLLGVRGIIRKSDPVDSQVRELVWLSLVTIGVPLCFTVLLIVSIFNNYKPVQLSQTIGRDVLAGFLISTIIVLAMLEQVVRNTRAHHQWHIKFLCLGLGILFAFELFLYSEAMLFGRLESLLWQARGFVIAFATVFIIVSIVRTRGQPIQVNISRQLVFHAGVLLASGFYLLLMSAAGYYIRSFQGEWGFLFQVLFLVVSLTFLAVLMLSGRARSFLKVYISRNLFSSKYDYRDEWMRISQTLSQPDSDEQLQVRAIQALASIVDSSAGALWLTTEGSYYDQVAQLNAGWIVSSTLVKEDSLIRYLIDVDRVVNLKDDKPDDFTLPDWIAQIDKAWLVVPLELHGDLLGFVVLKEPRVYIELNWEDYDLLKAAGKQTASYLAQMLASDALSEAREFNAFNQVSAFVVHDIKTLNSQLSMLVSNAERHKGNPSFIDDMIETTRHAVNKMDLLLKQFQNNKGYEIVDKQVLNLVELSNQIVREQSKFKPVPRLSCESTAIEVLAVDSEIRSTIAHLVQNAQDATPDNGEIELKLYKEGNNAVLKIVDTGSGMSKEFIQTRLFKPFVSTKGLTGMGIGVFQSRAYVRNLGGDLSVHSTPGKGSTFTLEIPLHETMK